MLARSIAERLRFLGGVDFGQADSQCRGLTSLLWAAASGQCVAIANSDNEAQ